MRLVRLALVCLAMGAVPPLVAPVPAPAPQRGGFELPVQLVGFPVIIIAVRMARFVKQLSYALNPQTYRSSSGSRQTRDLHDLHGSQYVLEVEKRLVAELGEHVCVFERVCAHYANLAESRGQAHHLDWNNVFSKYKSEPDTLKQFYLLSVFLGDIVHSPSLCHQLAKRGRGCSSAGNHDLEATA